MRKILSGEFKKYWSEIRTYYPDHVVSMIITFIIFSVFIILNQSSQDKAYYIGFLYWYLMSSIISEASVSISMEKQMGTLDQLLLKPIAIEWLMLTKTIVWTSVNLLKVLLVTILMIMILKIKIGFHLVLIPIFFITVIGILGFTLILVSLTLKYTKTASFESIISYALLFLTGAIIPYDLLPGVIQRVGNYIPIALGIRISRELINNKQVSLIELGALVGQSFIYFIIGYFIFKYIYRKSRINGLDHSY